MPAKKTAASQQTEVEEVSALDQMLGVVDQISKKDESVKAEMQDAVTMLFENVLGDYKTVSKEAPQLHHKIERLIADIDGRLSLQMNEIIHHPDFQKLEGSWRGLQHMVNSTDTGTNLKIKVLNLTKKELVKECQGRTRSGWDQSQLFKKIYEEEFGVPGGSPFGALVGDFEFSPKGQDVEVLKVLSRIAAASHSPFIAAAAPDVLRLDSWTDLNKRTDLKGAQEGAEFAAWRSLREDEDSRYLGLTAPRFLSRIPYGAQTNPVDGFAFEEDTDGSDHSKYTWSNAAYAMGTNINRAFSESGWATTIRGLESGGIVEDLPVHTFPTDDGGVDAKCPTEIAVTDRREKEMADLGLMPLSHYKNADYACFFGAQSLKKPTEYVDDEATANEALSCRLPYMFATCRFAHYLKCMVRDKIGAFMERDDMEQWLSEWVMQYVLKGGGDDEVKAKKPLADARVEVVDIDGDPGNYRATFFLRPHFQLEGLTASLRLVSDLSQKS